MDMGKILLSEQQFDELKYRKWKKENVTYRGIKDVGTEDNGNGAMLGRGLYTVPKSNISMARTYGELRFVVNARPKNPKVFQNLTDWEIWFQNNLLAKYDYDKRKFNKVTTIEAEMLKLGYDGVIITGREIVNYTPKDILYFTNERQLEMYYESNISPSI